MICKIQFLTAIVVHLIGQPIAAQLPYYACAFTDDMMGCHDSEYIQYNQMTARNMSGNRCFCDSQCEILGDCCDPVEPPPPARIEFDHSHKCIKLPFYGSRYVGMYTKITCLDGSTCQSQENDPFSLLPASSKTTGTTYRNVFCAFCNRENFHDLLFGNLTVKCLKGFNVSMAIGNPLKYFAHNHTPSAVRDNCTLIYQPSENFQHTKCLPSIDVCPSETDPNDAANCAAYMRTIIHGGQVFKNPHCAICNGLHLDDITYDDCISPLLLDHEAEQPELEPQPELVPQFANKSSIFQGTGVLTNPVPGYSMTIILDLNLDDGNIIGTQRKCQEGHVFDPWMDYCRQVFCPQGQRFDEGSCRSAKYEDAQHDVPPTPGNEPITLPWQPISRCPRIEFRPSDYYLVGKTLYINSSGKLYNLTDVTFNDSVASVCWTTEYEEFVDSFSVAETYLSIVCYALSLVCLSLHFCVYILAGKYRMVPDLNMLSISLAIFLMHIFFLAAPVVQRFSLASSTLCLVTAVLMHYFVLCSFTWSTVIAYDITKSVLSLEHPTFNTVTYSSYIRYSLFAWIVPCIPIIIGLTLDAIVPDNDYSPFYGKHICWVGRRKSLLVLVAAPIAVILLANIMFYGITASVLWKSQTARESMKTTQQKPASHQSRFRLYVKLGMIMGVAWITGFLAIVVPQLRYVNILANGLQGVYIFLAFSCKKSTLKAMKSHRWGIGSVIFDRLNSFGSKKSGSSNLSSLSSRKSPARNVESHDLAVVAKSYSLQESPTNNQKKEKVNESVFKS